MQNENKGIMFGIYSGFFAAVAPILSNYAMKSQPLVLYSSMLLIAPIITSFFGDFFGFIVTHCDLIRKKEWKCFYGVLLTKKGFYALLAGFFGGTVASLTMYMSIYLAGAIFGLTVSMTFPIVGAIISRVVFKERLVLKGWLAVALCVVGSILISLAPGGGDYPHLWLGIICGVISSVAYALEGIIAQRVLQEVTPEITNAAKYLVSMICYFVFILPMITGKISVMGFSIAWEVLLSASIIIYIGIGVSRSVSYHYYYKSIDCLGAPIAMALSTTNTLWNALFAFLVFGVMITLTMSVGIGCTLIGISLLAWIQNKELEQPVSS